MYIFDPTGWWNRASHDPISQETRRKKRENIVLNKVSLQRFDGHWGGLPPSNFAISLFSLRSWIIARVSYIRGRSLYRRSANSSGILGEIRGSLSSINNGVADLVDGMRRLSTSTLLAGNLSPVGDNPVAGMRRLPTSPLSVGDISSMGDMTSRFGVDIVRLRWGVGVVFCQPEKCRLSWCRYGAAVVRAWL